MVSLRAKNLAIEWRAYGRRLGLISQYVAELVPAQPDVIHAVGGIAIRAVQKATKSIPNRWGHRGYGRGVTGRIIHPAQGQYNRG